MNIENIYYAVSEDEMNSPLVSICYELERQGYNVKLEGVDITSSELEENVYTDLEHAVNEFNIELLKNSLPELKFKIVFTDYHKFHIQQVG